jgi:hypothetical protein
MKKPCKKPCTAMSGSRTRNGEQGKPSTNGYTPDHKSKGTVVSETWGDLLYEPVGNGGRAGTTVGGTYARKIERQGRQPSEAN